LPKLLKWEAYVDYVIYLLYAVRVGRYSVEKGTEQWKIHILL
jgi:hypothetical protein